MTATGPIRGKVLEVWGGTGHARYEWTVTGMRMPSGTRLHAQPFASNLPGLVPTGSNSGLFLKDDGTWATPSVGGSASGLTLAQLAPAPPSTIVGRYSAGSGAHEDLTPTQVATMLPVFTVAGKGVVPPPGSAANNFLRDDGTWASPGSSSATGVSNAQLGPVPPLTFKGSDLASSGTVRDLTATAAAGMLAPALVGPLPSGAVAFRQGSGFGGATGFRVLNLGSPSLTVIVDGKLDVSGGSSVLGEARASSLQLTGSGLGNDSLADMASTSVKANSGSTGAAADVQIATLTSLLTQFSDVTQGVAPLSGGGTANYLRADGSWSQPPGVHTGFTATGITNAQLDFAPSGTVKGRISGTGTVEDIGMATMTAMLRQFSSADQGVVPASGGGSSNYLRADGSWSEPPGTGGGGGGTPGGANPSVQFNAGGGQFGGASGFLIVASGSAMQVGGPGAASVGWLRGGPTMSVYGQAGATDVNMIRMGTGAVVVGQSGVALKTFGDLSAQNLTLASGLADSQLAPMGSGTVKGRLTGTGTPGDISIPTLHAFAPTFTSARPGTVPESGGGTDNYLRADGSWSQPPGVHTGFTATGITNAQLAVMPTGTVKANLSGTAAPSDVAIATLHAFAPTFTSLRAGTVPPSGGGSSNYLRADGTWDAPPGTGGASPSGIDLSVQFNSGGSFDGATGIRVVGSGTALRFGAATAAASGMVRLPNAPGRVLGYLSYSGVSRNLLDVTGDGTFDDVAIGDGSSDGTTTIRLKTALQTILSFGSGDYYVAKATTFQMPSGSRLTNPQSVRLEGLASTGTVDFRVNSQDMGRVTASGWDIRTKLSAPTAPAELQALTLASGLSNANLAPMGSGTVKGNLSGTGAPSDIAVATLHAFAPTFTAAQAGTVPPSGGGTSNFLRADGTWSTPPAGSGSPAGGEGNVQFNDGAGSFGGASGINIVASGRALGIGVPSLLPSVGDIRVSTGLDTVVATGGEFRRSFGGVTALSERLLPTGLDLSNFHIRAKSIDAPHFNGLPTDQNNLYRGADIPNASGHRLYVPGGASTGAHRYVVPSGTLSAARTVLLIPTGAVAGDVVRIEKIDTTGNTLTVATPTGTTLTVMPSGTKAVADFVFTKPSGPNFELGGRGRLF